MEVRDIRAFFEKRDQSTTKTFIINMTIGLCAFLLIGGIANVVSAQEETPEETAAETGVIEATTTEDIAPTSEESSVPGAAAEEKKADIAEKKAEMAEKKEERKAALSEKASDRIVALANKISEKMAAAIERMDQIITRIEERMVILADKGVDTTEAAAQLEAARTHLNTTTMIINTEVDALVDNAVYSEAPKENWGAAKAKYQEAREELRSAHTDIKEAVALLKDAMSTAEQGQGVSEAVRNDTTETEETSASDDT